MVLWNESLNQSKLKSQSNQNAFQSFYKWLKKKWDILKTAIGLETIAQQLQ